MKHTRRDGTKSVRGRRDHALVVVGAIVVGIGIGGVGAVLAGGSPSDRRSAFDAPEASRQQARTPIETSRSEPRLTLDPTPVDLPDPAPDPNALADGVYPTFVRAVDVDGATITVDVLQVFAGAEQRQA